MIKTLIVLLIMVSAFQWVWGIHPEDKNRSISAMNILFKMESDLNQLNGRVDLCEYEKNSKNSDVMESFNNSYDYFVQLMIKKCKIKNEYLGCVLEQFKVIDHTLSNNLTNLTCQKNNSNMCNCGIPANRFDLVDALQLDERLKKYLEGKKNSIQYDKKTGPNICKKYHKCVSLFTGFITENLKRENQFVSDEYNVYTMKFFKNINRAFVEGYSYPSMNDKKQSAMIKKHLTNLGVVKNSNKQPVIFRSGRSDNPERVDELIKFVQEQDPRLSGYKNDVIINSFMDFSYLKRVGSLLTTKQDNERGRLKEILKSLTAYYPTNDQSNDSFNENIPIFLNTSISGAEKGIGKINVIGRQEDSEKVNLWAYTQLCYKLLKKENNSKFNSRLITIQKELLPLNKILDLSSNRLKKIKSNLLSIINERIEDDREKNIQLSAFLSLNRLIEDKIQNRKMKYHEKILDQNFIKFAVDLPMAVQCKSGVDRTGAGVLLSIAAETDGKRPPLNALDALIPQNLDYLKKRFACFSGPLALTVSTYTRGKPGLKWGHHPIPREMLSGDSTIISNKKWTEKGKSYYFIRKSKSMYDLSDDEHSTLDEDFSDD